MLFRSDGTDQFDVFFPLLILRSFSWVPLPEKVASAPGVFDDGPFFCGNFFCNAVPRLSSTPKRSGDSDAGLKGTSCSAGPVIHWKGASLHHSEGYECLSLDFYKYQ